MKTIAKSLIAMAVAVSLSACGSKDTLEVSTQSGTLNCSATVSDMAATRSQLTVAEDQLSEASVVVYDAAGNFVKSIFTTDMTAISFPLLHIGETYHIYAAFNAGSLTFPLSESDIGTLSFSWDPSSVNTKGFLMTWSGSVTLSSDGQNVAMEATRLVSKVRFSVSNSSLSDHGGAYTVSSVALQNSVRTVSVFSASQPLLGEAAYSSDSATASDIMSVNAGNKISFYTFENLCGTLLPGNTDPWNKVPANISGKEDRCTYLEVTGTYSTDGGTATAPVTYRMYLGENATTNFDLVRNYIYDVTLAPSDEGIDRTSWKITRGAFSDSRSLSFSPASVTMNVNGSATFTVSPSPSGMAYTVTRGAGFDSSTLTLTPTGNTNEYSLVSSGSLSSDAVTSVVATSWDGRVSASLPVTVKAKYPVAAAVSLTKGSIAPGETSTATTEITYNDGTKKTVTTAATYFFSPATSLAAISGNIITAVNSGDVSVKAQYAENGVTVTSSATKLHIYTVTCSLSIDQGSSVKIGKGSVKNLTCTQKTFYDGAFHSSDNVTELASWANPSTVEDYVLVSNTPGSKGQITGVNFGTVTVQTSYNGNTASVSVEVVRPDFELKVETYDASIGNPQSYIIVYVMEIDPFSGVKTAIATVQTECSYSGSTVTKNGGLVYVDFYYGGSTPTEDESRSFTATYTGSAGGKVKYGTKSVSGTCRFKAE